jgi:hypothetical protein
MGGCVVSSQFKQDPNLPGHDEKSISIFRDLHLNENEMGMLWKHFVNIKSTGLGVYVDVDELVAFLGHQTNNELCLRMFRRFSISRGDKLDLCEFVATFWVFLTLSTTELSAFCFMNCDNRALRTMERYGAGRMVRLLHDTVHVRDKDEEGNKFLEAIEDEGITKLTLRQFVDYASEHPLLCEPIYELVTDKSVTPIVA